MARLSWQPPNGPTSSTLTGYRIRYGQAPGSYSRTVELADASLRSYDIALTTGTYYFAMSTLNGSGVETARSNEVSKTIE
jgi:hypothetical protein